MGQICTPVFIISLIFLLYLILCQGQCRSGSNSFSSLLNMLSPANLEALKRQKGAAVRKKIPNEYFTNAVPNFIPSNVLPNVYGPPNVLPNVPIYQKPVMPKLVEAVDVPKRVCANPVPVKPPVVITDQPVLPAPLVNPFLPAASPVSALAPPTSNLLPPADLIHSKCNFLRKIPIPPPTL